MVTNFDIAEVFGLKRSRSDRMRMGVIASVSGDTAEVDLNGSGITTTCRILYSVPAIGDRVRVLISGDTVQAIGKVQS